MKNNNNKHVALECSLYSPFSCTLLSLPRRRLLYHPNPLQSLPRLQIQDLESFLRCITQTITHKENTHTIRAYSSLRSGDLTAMVIKDIKSLLPVKKSSSSVCSTNGLSSMEEPLRRRQRFCISKFRQHMPPRQRCPHCCFFISKIKVEAAPYGL